MKKLGNFALRMKKFLILTVFIYCMGSLTAQQKDSVRPRPDTNRQAVKSQMPARAVQPKNDSNQPASAHTPAKKITDSNRATKVPVAASISTEAAKKDSSKTRNTGDNRSKKSTSTGTPAQTPEMATTTATNLVKDHHLRDSLQSVALYRHTHGLTMTPKDYLPAFLKGKSALHPLTGGVNVHPFENRDYLFYCFLGITLLLGLIKILFPRYFNQIFWFFLHPNDRKKNQSEQISGQNILPSLLLNLFFAITGGLFLSEIFKPKWPGASFWRNWIIFTAVLVTVYLIKFMVIKLSGWLFNSPVAASTYNNVVFSINKVIGLLLLPSSLLMAYGSANSTSFAYSFAVILIAILLIYRYIASFLLIKGKLKVNAFHFILYLCAVEIIPLLLVYRVLFNNIGQFI